MKSGFASMSVMLMCHTVILFVHHRVLLEAVEEEEVEEVVAQALSMALVLRR